MPVDINRYIAKIRQTSTWIGLALHELQTGHNNLETNVAGTSNTKLPPPPPIDNLNVKASNGTVHIVQTHNQPINKGIQYLTEASANDPSFTQPHPIDQGSSRSHFTTLPGNDDDNHPITWYFRTTAQYQGSDASEHTYFGDRFNPTGVTVGGTAQLTPIPSTGGGTASGTGKQPGLGLGTDFKRL